MYAGINGMWRVQLRNRSWCYCCQKTFYVMCGGDLSEPTLVSEQYLLILKEKPLKPYCWEENAWKDSKYSEDGEALEELIWKCADQLVWKLISYSNFIEKLFYFQIFKLYSWSSLPTRSRKYHRHNLPGLLHGCWKANTCIRTLQQWGYDVMVGKNAGKQIFQLFQRSRWRTADELQAMLDDNPFMLSLRKRRLWYGEESSTNPTSESL